MPVDIKRKRVRDARYRQKQKENNPEEYYKKRQEIALRRYYKKRRRPLQKHLALKNVSVISGSVNIASGNVRKPRPILLGLPPVPPHQWSLLMR
jgi:hypothetical protein